MVRYSLDILIFVSIYLKQTSVNKIIFCELFKCTLVIIVFVIRMCSISRRYSISRLIEINTWSFFPLELFLTFT